MPESCPISTAAETIFYDGLSKAERVLLDTVRAALREAEATAAAALIASGLEGPSPPLEYFAASLLQQLFCVLCGADPHSFLGGDPNKAIPIIRNSQNIAAHYWGVDRASFAVEGSKATRD